MIAQLKKGSGFAGLISYCRKMLDEKSRIIAHEGVCVVDAKMLSASLSAQARMNPNVKQFVGHCMLAFSPEDAHKLTDERMVKIAQEYMKRMKIVNTQYVIYRHLDQPHPHVHIAYNRVNNEGKEIKSDSNFRASVGVTQALTREYGLTFGKGKKGVRRERLRAKDKIKYQMYDTIKASLPLCKSWDELREILRKKGISMTIKTNNDGRHGVVFSIDNISFAGSKIDRSLSYSHIAEALDRNVKFDMKYTPTKLEHFSGYTREKTEENTHVGEPVREPIVREPNRFIQGHSLIRLPYNTAKVDDEIENDLGQTGDTSASSSSVVRDIAMGVAEVILQPNAELSIGGGGGSSSSDDDDDNEEKRRKPRYRRR